MRWTFLVPLAAALAITVPAAAQQQGQGCSDKAIAGAVRGTWKTTPPGADEWKDPSLMPLVDAVNGAMREARITVLNGSDVYLTRFLESRGKLYQKIVFARETQDQKGRPHVKGKALVQDARSGKVAYRCDHESATKYRLFAIGKIEQGKFWIPKDKQ